MHVYICYKRITQTVNYNRDFFLSKLYLCSQLLAGEVGCGWVQKLLLKHEWHWTQNKPDSQVTDIIWFVWRWEIGTERRCTNKKTEKMLHVMLSKYQWTYHQQWSNCLICNKTKAWFMFWKCTLQIDQSINNPKIYINMNTDMRPFQVVR